MCVFCLPSGRAFRLAQLAHAMKAHEGDFFFVRMGYGAWGPFLNLILILRRRRRRRRR